MCRYLENRRKLLTDLTYLPCSRPAGFMLTTFVCLFAFGSNAWTQCEIEKITAHDGGASDRFGFSVSISGKFTIIGSPLNDGAGNDNGAAYVYRYDVENSIWTQQEKLTASDAEPGKFGDLFGCAVSISGYVAVIGASADNDACPNIPEFCNSGSAYVFRYDPKLSQWIEEDKLIASDGEAEDQFGTAVSINGDVVVVGVPFNDDIEDNSGSAYVFRKDINSSEWVEEAKLIASDENELGVFGFAVAIQNDVIVIIGRSNNADLGIHEGTAYVFRYDPKSGVWNEELEYKG